MWGGVAAAVMLSIAYVAWSERSEQLEAIENKRASVEKFSKRATKAQELQDVLTAVRQWQRNDITWLDELDQLSERFPTRQQSLVRRMSLSSASNGAGVVDLSVQVSSPEVVAALESAIRDERHSVTSKRVSEVADVEGLNWAFETRIVFRPLPRPPLQVIDEAEPVEQSAKGSATEFPADTESNAEDAVQTVEVTEEVP